MTSIEREKLPVLLSIRGEQYFDNVDPDATELMTDGTLELTDTGMLLSYQETELTGMEGTVTTFEVKGPQVILTRTGKVNSQMVFEEGRRHLSMYDTPYGALSIGVNTRRMRSDLSASGGSIEIDYAIESDHALAGQNLFRIQIREKGPVLKQ